MHIIQQKILQLTKQLDISSVGLRKLGQLVGESHPQKVKHHLEQLEKKGFLQKDANNHSITATASVKSKTAPLFNLPIMGSANCGPADIYAEENIEGYLKISPAVTGRKKPEGLFIIKAVGDSMNKATAAPGGPIENGDYVIIDSHKKAPHNGDYVLSVIDDVANIKRFYHDTSRKQIALVSESTLPIQPIYIHGSDADKYLVNGQIVQVIKRPNFV
ncbi:hypothetical protein HGA34_03525 [Candidatus Falkowbacteria bacterium]|nr:hypothetical protein [Candidatus Falkowbacteria bacterium]